MGHIGFSYIGFLYLLLLFLPNLLWAKRPPDGYKALAKQENKGLLVCERIGQVGVTCCALLFQDPNPAPFTPWSLWLIASALLMLLYEAAWVRYFRSGRTCEELHRRFCGVPVPLAVLPVAAFLLLGVYGKVLWLMLAALLLGVGHIGIHLQHVRLLAAQTRALAK